MHKVDGPKTLQKTLFPFEDLILVRTANEFDANAPPVLRFCPRPCRTDFRRLYWLIPSGCTVITNHTFSLVIDDEPTSDTGDREVE